MGFGILIALVIAFTLWVHAPAKQTSQSFGIKNHLPVAAAKNIIKAATDVLLY